MKNSILLFILMCCAGSAGAQTKVIDPVETDYSATATFNRLTITPTQTIAEITLRYYPNYWVRYDSLSDVLQDCNSNRQYKLLKAEGFELNKEVYMPASGEMKVTFFFEPIDTDVQTVDFIDLAHPDEQQTHQTYGIHLTKPDPRTSLPVWAKGNWMSTDGSNQWVCGFTPKTAIWQCDFWDYDTIMNKGKTLIATLHNNNSFQKVYLRQGKENTLLFSTDNKNFTTLSREITPNNAGATDWKYNPQPYYKKFFQPEPAVIRGLIESYTPKLGGTTGLVDFEDPVLRVERMPLIDIQPDGRFSVTLDMEYPRFCNADLLNSYISWFVAPGDTLMCYLNAQDLFPPRRTGLGKSARFMGQNALCNQLNEIFTMMTSRCLEYSQFRKSVQSASYEEFFTWNAQGQKQISDSLLTLFNRYNPDDWTRNILYSQIIVQDLYRRMEFERLYNDTEVKSSSQQPDGTWQIVKNENFKPLPKSFFDFLTMENMDNPLLLTSLDADLVINRLEYGPIFCRHKILNSFYVLPATFTKDMTEYARSQIKAEGLKLTPIQQKLLETLSFPLADSVKTQAKDTAFVAKFIKYVHQFIKQFNEQNEWKLTETYPVLFDTIKSYNLDRCVIYDYVLARDLSGDITESTYSDEQCFQKMTQMLPYVKTPFVAGKMVNYYMTERGNLKSGDSSAPKSQNSKADQFFETMIAPYQGNVLYIEFWSTACRSCLSDMIPAKEIVEELKDRKIKFLYVTCEDSSPLETANRFISENQIKGEQIRVTSDQWKLLQSKFNFNGIPHYEVVDKTGKLADPKNITRGNMKLTKAFLIKLIEQE